MFKINDNGIDQTNYDEVILKKIEEMKVLRDDFIDFLETYLTYSITIDSERLHNFFEKLLTYLTNIDEANYSTNTIGCLKYDSLRFFYYEIFLTFATIFLKKERYHELAYILQTSFVVQNNNSGQLVQSTFSEFRQYIATLNEHRNKKYQLNRVSVTADTLKQRATDEYNFDALKEADLLLYYLSLLFPNNKSYYEGYWFPETSCYWLRRTTILPKTISVRYFNKVKVLFGINDKEELLKLVEEITKKGGDRINSGDYHVPSIKAGLLVNEMCTIN